MKYDSFKYKIVQFGDRIVNSYFPAEDNVINKVANSMCKYILKTKMNMLDPYMMMFAKEDGEIDILEFVDYMKEHMIGDNGLKINLHEYVSILPDRTLTICKEDLNCFLN